MMNTLFNKVLGENEKCVFYVYLKTEDTFWPTQYLMPYHQTCYFDLHIFVNELNIINFKNISLVFNIIINFLFPKKKY